MDGLAWNVAALETHQVEAVQRRATVDCHAVGNHIARNAGNAADESVFADAAELRHRRSAADDDAVADFDVTTQLHAVGESHVVANLAIMADVGQYAMK